MTISMTIYLTILLIQIFNDMMRLHLMQSFATSTAKSWKNTEIKSAKSKAMRTIAGVVEVIGGLEKEH